MNAALLPAYEFKTEPFKHQFEEWNRSRDEVARAIFWEQGTGKSKLTIDTACWLYLLGKIDCVVVVAPNGVHRNWVENEIPDHVPNAIMNHSRAFHFQSPKSDSKWHKQAIRVITAHKGLAWFTISYEGFMTAAGKRALIDLFDKRRVFYVIDEGHNIKSPDAERTKSILRSSKYSLYRRLLTGTPIAQGPFDAYSEVKFLDEGFWVPHGLSTYTEFKQHFGVWRKGWNPNIVRWVLNKATGKKEQQMGDYYDDCVGYRRLDELNALLATISSRVTKDEVLDLPDKLYTKRYVTMTPEQAKIYRQMKEDYIVWLDSGKLEEEAEQVAATRGESACPICLGKGEVELDGYFYPCGDCGAKVGEVLQGTNAVVAELAIVRLLRLQQIACGYLPTEDEDEPMYMIPGTNRRLKEMCDEIETRAHKTIVWARFQLDITLILDELKARGIKAVRYDGQVSDDLRAEAKALFQGERPIFERGTMVGRVPIPEEEQAKVFVGNPAAGATGLTLTAARNVDYYSNSFKLIDRLQSEDRAHRIGQLNQVLYTDWITEDTVDEKIVDCLRKKFSIASQITGDKLKEWL